MAESKYKVIKVINQSEWAQDCPLFLVRSQIILHTESGKLFVVNEFANIGFQNVKGCVIRMECRGANGELLGNVDNCAYQNLDIARNAVFGGNKLFGLPEGTDEIGVIVKSVINADDTTYTNTALRRGIKIANPVKIDPADEAYDVLSERVGAEGVKIKFWPQKFEGGWRCTCAQINSDSVDVCPLCGVKREFAVEQMDREGILAYKEQVRREEEERIRREEEARQAAIRAEEERKRKEEEERLRKEEEERQAAIRAEEERKRKEEEERRAQERARLEALMAKKEAIQKYNMKQRVNDIKRAFILIVLSISIIVIGVVGFGFYQTARTASRYDSAKNTAASATTVADYEKAIAGFTSLGSYRDSEAMVKQTKYDYAEALIAENRYEDAINIYKELGLYKSSAQNIPQTYLKWGDYARASSDYEQAYYCYEHAGSLASSEVKYQLSFDYGSYLVNQNQYAEAVEVLDSLGVRDMSGVDTLLAKCYYGLGDAAFKSRNYTTAIEYFNKCIGYENTENYLRQTYYMLAQQYDQKQDYENAYNCYVNAGDYNDASDRKDVLVIRLAEQYAAEKNYNKAAAYYNRATDLEQANQDVYYETMYYYAEYMLKSNVTERVYNIYKMVPAADYPDAAEKVKIIGEYIDYVGTYKATSDGANPAEVYVRMIVVDGVVSMRANGSAVDMKTLKAGNITLNKNGTATVVEGDATYSYEK